MIVERILEPDYTNPFWMAFDDEGGRGRAVFVRFFPGDGYAYDIVLLAPLKDTAEVDLRRFIERDISN